VHSVDLSVSSSSTSTSTLSSSDSAPQEVLQQQFHDCEAKMTVVPQPPSLPLPSEQQPMVSPKKWRASLPGMRLLQTSSWCIYTLMKIRAISMNEVEHCMKHLIHQYTLYLVPLPGTLPSFYPIPVSPLEHEWMRESCLRYYKSMWSSPKLSFIPDDPPMLHDVRWSIEKRMHQMRALQPSSSTWLSSSLSPSMVSYYWTLPRPLPARIEFKVSDDIRSIDIQELVNRTLSGLATTISPNSSSSSSSMIPSWCIRWPRERRDEFVGHSFRYYRRSLLRPIRQLLIASNLKPSGRMPLSFQSSHIVHATLCHVY
jgi:hypothetical protein